MRQAPLVGRLTRSEQISLDHELIKPTRHLSYDTVDRFPAEAHLKQRVDVCDGVAANLLQQLSSTTSKVPIGILR